MPPVPVPQASHSVVDPDFVMIQDLSKLDLSKDRVTNIMAHHFHWIRVEEETVSTRFSILLLGLIRRRLSHESEDIVEMWRTDCLLLLQTFFETDDSVLSLLDVLTNQVRSDTIKLLNKVCRLAHDKVLRWIERNGTIPMEKFRAFFVFAVRCWVW